MPLDVPYFRADSAWYLGAKNYELTDHLGNVTAALSDRKQAFDTNADKKADYYEPIILSATDYYPFGFEMPGRKFNIGDYRYGFNGKEADRRGEWASLVRYDYGFRVYDSALGRFLSIDPLARKYPWYTPYQFAGNMPIKYIDLDGLEPANNPEDPANQNGRNPTKTINSIYEKTGGEENFRKNFANYMQGEYNSNATVSGISNKSGYTSDSKDGADKGNLWVNSTGVFKASDYENFDSRDFSNFLLGSMINGIFPENIEFPVNGTVSNYMKEAGIVSDAMSSWYTLNKGRSTLVGGQAEFSGNSHMLDAAMTKGIFHLESFVGSATITITPINDTEVMVKIFNVTSLTSGDYNKSFPWNSVPMSVVRDPSKPSSSGANKYGNISQTYQFTMPIDASKL
jgi:RHS repeat-associated protein